MNSKARITYRFDKETGTALVANKPVEKERPAKSNVTPYFQEELTFSSDIGTWNSPFQNDSQALEELIRDTDREPERANRPAPADAARKEINERLRPDMHYDRESPDKQIPLGEEPFVPARGPEIVNYPIIEWDEDDRRSGKASLGAGKLGSFQTAVSYRPGRNPSWFKVLASVIGAIATGAIFGYFALVLFSGETPVNEGTDANTPAASASAAGNNSASGNGQKQDAAVSGTADSDGKTADAGASGTVQVNIPAVSYAMLQYGVFSSKDGLNAALADLENKGLAAASLTGDQDYRVYVGMAANRDEALELGQALPGMDVYVKDIEIPALQSISYGGKAEEAEAFFKQTGELIALMDSSTIKLLEGQSGTIDADWSGQHQQWIKTASTFESGIADKTGKTVLLQLVQKVNSAAVAAQEYAKKSSTAHLWAMQTALMEAVFAQKTWFASMDAL